MFYVSCRGHQNSGFQTYAVRRRFFVFYVAELRECIASRRVSDEIHQLYAVYGWSVVALLDVCGDLRGRCLTFGARRSSDQPATEQRLERFGQVSTDVVLFDVDLLEEGLVEQSPGLGAGGEVGRVAVASASSSNLR